MRLTRVMYKQHIDRWFHRQWMRKRDRVPVETGIEATLIEKGFPVVDALDLIDKSKEAPLPRYELNVIGMVPQTLPKNENHPEYKSRTCFELRDKSLLIEGLPQAQVLTNCVQVKQGLPSAIEEAADEFETKKSDEFDHQAQSCILNAQIFDAYQEKLPKIKNPLKPMYVFPRIYGVADYRRNRLTTQRLIELSSTQGLTVKGALVQSVIQKGDALVRFEVEPGALLCAPRPVQPYGAELAVEAEAPLPDIFPLNPTASLKTSHFYDDRDIFPNLPPKNYVNTAIFHFDETRVTNVHEEPVLDAQFTGRTLTNTYTVALAAAKQQTHKVPVTVHGVHTDGRRFHFLVLQLNSVHDDGPRNIFWSSKIMNLFSSCAYESGKPKLKNYDSRVLSTFLALCGSRK